MIGVRLHVIASIVRSTKSINNNQHKPHRVADIFPHLYYILILFNLCLIFTDQIGRKLVEKSYFFEIDFFILSLERSISLLFLRTWADKSFIICVTCSSIFFCNYFKGLRTNILAFFYFQRDDKILFSYSVKRLRKSIGAFISSIVLISYCLESIYFYVCLFFPYKIDFS